jgi:hypothetical protein
MINYGLWTIDYGLINYDEQVTQPSSIEQLGPAGISSAT